jgi:hypothetical protein
MSGDPTRPDDSAADRDVTRRWREQSVEQPAPATDARVRAAAREALRAVTASSTDRARRSGRWSRIVPLAAAASVALLAIGLVRLIPRDEYQAIPVTPEAAVERDAAPETTPPSAPTTAAAPPPAPLETERADAPRATATDSSEVPDSGVDLRAVIRPAAVPGEAPTAEERPSQARREPSGAAQEKTPLRAAPSATAAPAAAEAAAPSSATAITTTGALRGADSGLAAPLPARLAGNVLEDAARRAGGEQASIRIVAVERVMWFDTSLGCKAGAFATPEMRVPGYLVTVEAGGTVLRYHTDDGERIRICDDE